MPEVVTGNDVSLLCDVDGDDIAIGCATSITLEFTNELIGKTDVNAGLFRKKRVRISDCRGSIQGLLTLYNTSSKLSAMYFLQEAIRRTEQALTFLFTDQAGTIRYVRGNFLVATESISSQVGDFAEFDLSFEGTGNITISELESPPDPTCFEANSDWWQPTNGATSFNGLGNAGRSFAGHEIIEVVREMAPPLSYTAGTPGERDYSFDGINIGIWASNPFNGDERVFVIWQEVV